MVQELDDDIDLQPVDEATGSEPVVSDVYGRLWRVRPRLGAELVDLALAMLILLVFAAIGTALLM